MRKIFTASRVQNLLQPLLVVLALCVVSVSTSCTPLSPSNDADVVVVGAGIAGLAAALEAAAQGASVVVIEAASVGGGHAVKAGGFAMVDTALQRRKGIEDSAELAFKDLLAWGEDPNTYWAQRYAQESGAEVHDWLTNLGVEFVLLIPTPEHSVPRFHFTRGRAVNVVVPMLRKALQDPKIRFVWNMRATALLKSKAKITGVLGTDERTGIKQRFAADSVVLTTGGFATNLSKVRANWPADKQIPTDLLIGSGHYASGDGYRLAEWAGADLQNLDRQVIFYNGMPDPRDASSNRALHAQNSAAIWVNKQGRRFVNETADSKTVETAVSSLDPISYWVVYDANGAKRWQIRDADWLNKDTLGELILNNSEITVKADSIDELAKAAGIATHGLNTTLETWNRMVDVGTDFQHGRFTKDNNKPRAQALVTPPFYATRLYPYTRKSMGGPAINLYAQVLDESRTPIDGLFAAGELTGVAGINGKHGGSGSFLGPAVLTGRIAGASAAAASSRSGALKRGSAAQSTQTTQSQADSTNPGYWHFNQSHARVTELEWSCNRCHTDRHPQRMAVTANEMLNRLNTCLDCH